LYQPKMEKSTGDDDEVFTGAIQVKSTSDDEKVFTPSEVDVIMSRQ
jgi:hypothetical protein